MEFKVLYEVPEEIGDPHLDLFGEEILRFQYERNGEKKRAGLRFHAVGAVQIRARKCLEEWQHDSYFQLVEVSGSPWKESILSAVHEQYARYKQAKHHYAILGLNIGYEFIADSWELLPERDGWGDFPRLYLDPTRGTEHGRS
jgi:hypothetical protein